MNTFQWNLYFWDWCYICSTCMWIICVCVCVLCVVYVHFVSVHTHACGSQRRVYCVTLHHSLPCSSEIGSLTGPGVVLAASLEALVNFVFPQPRTRVASVLGNVRLLCGCWVFMLESHACARNALPHWAISLTLLYVFVPCSHKA